MGTQAEAKLVAQAAAHVKHSVRGPQRIACPLCELEGKRDRKHSLAVWPSGWYQCWRCKGKGRIAGAVDFQAIVDQDEVELEHPAEFLALRDEAVVKARSSRSALRYMARRGVPLTMLQVADAGLCHKGRHAGRVIFPVYKAGAWAGHVGRCWVESDLPYLYPRGFDRGSVLWNHDALQVRTEKPLMICEGVLDALPYFPSASAVLGKLGGDHESLLVAARRPLVICLDGDSWEEGWALAQKLVLLGQRADAVALPPGKDPGDVDREWLQAQVDKIEFEVM